MLKLRNTLTVYLSIFGITLSFCGCVTTSKDWKEAEQQNTVSAYQMFLQKHPNTEQTDLAKHRLEQLKSESAWELTMSSPSITSYSSFIERYPKSGRVYDAKRELQKLGRFDPINTDYAKFGFKIKNVEILNSLETTDGTASLIDSNIILVTIEGYSNTNTGVLRQDDDFLVTYSDKNTMVIEHEIAMKNKDLGKWEWLAAN